MNKKIIKVLDDILEEDVLDITYSRITITTSHLSYDSYTVKYKTFICTVYRNIHLDRNTGYSTYSYRGTLDGVRLNKLSKRFLAVLEELFERCREEYKTSPNNPEVALQTKLDNYK